jgi:TonB family protein
LRRLTLLLLEELHMLVAFLAAAAGAALPQARPIDRASWFKPSDYPADATRGKIQGSVGFEVDVDANGNARECGITRSSGHEMLDKATCDIVRARAHFEPARDKHGKAVAGRYSTSTVWLLDDWGIPGATPINRPSWFSSNDYPFEAMKAGVEGSVSFEVDVDASGKPTACRVMSSSGHQILDKATCDIVLSRARFALPRGSGDTSPAGRYSTKTVWRLDSPPTFYSAAIVDYSIDPDNPVCITKSSDPTQRVPTCKQLLERAGPSPDIAKQMAKVVVMLAEATGEATPYPGEPEWGPRLAHMVADIYQLKLGVPTACVSIAAEGFVAGHDPCAGVPGARTISDANKSAAIKTRIEVSTFGLPRSTARHASSE